MSANYMQSPHPRPLRSPGFFVPLDLWHVCRLPQGLETCPNSLPLYLAPTSPVSRTTKTANPFYLWGWTLFGPVLAPHHLVPFLTSISSASGLHDALLASLSSLTVLVPSRPGVQGQTAVQANFLLSSIFNLGVHPLRTFWN